MPRFDAASISTQVHRPALADRDARRAGVARVAVLEVRAVDGLGEDPRERRLARAARPDEQDRVRDPFGPDGVAERLDDGLLPDDLGEGLGPPAAVDRLVGLGGWSGRRSRSVDWPARARGRANRWSCCRAPPVDRPTPGPTAEGGSDQAVPRHPTSFAECCFLPDLTRFAIRRCAGPDPQRRLERRPPGAEASRGNSALLERIAGTGHR